MVERFLRKTNHTMRRESITQRETITVARLEKLDILTSRADINVITHDEPRIDIVFETYEGGPNLTTKNYKDFVEIIVKEPRNRIPFSFNTLHCRLQLSVPRDIADSWNIKMDSGDVSSSGLLADSLNIRLSSGNLELQDIYVRKATIESCSGDLSVKSFKMDELHFEASSGKVQLEDGNGNITGMTSSGDVVVTDVQGRSVEIVTSSGNVKADHFNTKNVMTKTSSGDMELRDFSGDVKGYTDSGDVILSPIEGCSIDMVTDSGDITVIAGKNSLNAKIDISTGSGDMMIDLPMNVHNHTSKGFEGIIGEGENRIRLNSGSGDVKLL